MHEAAARQEVITAGPAETQALGTRLGRKLRGGEVVFLFGDFGTGKTVLVKGIAEALGIVESSVTSPSFTLVQTYHGRLTVHHADLYRLERQEEIAELAIEELVGAESVVIIEWAQHWLNPGVPADYRIELSHEGGDRRRIAAEPPID